MKYRLFKPLEKFIFPIKIQLATYVGDHSCYLHADKSPIEIPWLNIG